jgi:hypothetical protein
MSDTNTIPAVLDRTPVEVTVVRTPCLCGCGGFPAREGARFIPGHDAKLKSMLIKAHLEGVEKITIKNGDESRDVTPLEMATELDWQPFLEHAMLRAERDAAAKAAKAEAAKAS